MRKRSHIESEMVNAVKQLESGVDAESVSRELGISQATLYNWKSKYSGMDVSQVQRLHELEEENLQDVCDITERWQLDYNTTCPHEALGNMTPM